MFFPQFPFREFIPHFTNYPLITKKQADFILFKSVVDIMIKGEHLTQKGLNKILSLKSSINWGLPDTLKDAFPYISPAIRPDIQIPETINPFWFAGFTRRGRPKADFVPLWEW